MEFISDIAVNACMNCENLRSSIDEGSARIFQAIAPSLKEALGSRYEIYVPRVMCGVKAHKYNLAISKFLQTFFMVGCTNKVLFSLHTYERYLTRVRSTIRGRYVPYDEDLHEELSNMYVPYVCGVLESPGFLILIEGVRFLIMIPFKALRGLYKSSDISEKITSSVRRQSYYCLDPRFLEEC